MLLIQNIDETNKGWAAGDKIEWNFCSLVLRTYAILKSKVIRYLNSLKFRNTIYCIQNKAQTFTQMDGSFRGSGAVNIKIIFILLNCPVHIMTLIVDELVCGRGRIN
jgi:hypothetical protein